MDRSLVIIGGGQPAHVAGGDGTQAGKNRAIWQSAKGLVHGRTGSELASREIPKQILWFPLPNLHTFPAAGTSPPPLTDKFLSILKLTSRETVSPGLTKSVGSASSGPARLRHPTHCYGPGSDRLVFVLYQHFPLSKFP